MKAGPDPRLAHLFFQCLRRNTDQIIEALRERLAPALGTPKVRVELQAMVYSCTRVDDMVTSP